MTDSNLVKLAYAEEVTFNTHPGSGADWNELRILSESFKQDLALTSSSEIRGYRDIPSLTKTDRSVSGGFNQSLYYDTTGANKLFQYALGTGAFSSPTSVEAGAVAIDQTTRKYTATLDHEPSLGEWVYISGAADSASNGYKQVESSAPGYFTVNSPIGANEGSPTLAITQLGQMVNRETLTTLAFQRCYTKAANGIGEHFTGCAIDSIDIDASGQDTVKMNTTVIGVTATSDAAVEDVDNVADTTAEMTSINGVQFVREGTGAGAHVDMDVLGFTMNISNGIRQQYKLGTFGASGLKHGDFVVTGTLQAYFENATLFDKFLNQTATALSICISDEATSEGVGNAYIFDMPNVRFTDGQRVAGGRNQDIIAEMSFQAIYDGQALAAGHTLKIAHHAI
jgi:hypothetical protein